MKRIMADTGDKNMNFVGKDDGQQVVYNTYSSDCHTNTVDYAPESNDCLPVGKQRHFSMNSSKSRSNPNTIRHGSHEPRNDLSYTVTATSEPSTINLNPSLQDSFQLGPIRCNSKLDPAVTQLGHDSKPFKLLSTKAEKNLKGKNLAAWKSYRQALVQRFPEKAEKKSGMKVKKRERKIQKLINKTAEVDGVLSRVGRWPLPPENRTTTNKILMGETLYAREPKWPPNSQTNFRYPPFLNDKGMPYKVSDFSYQEFVPIFLVENHERIETLTTMEIADAFRTCIKVVFPHVHWAHQDMLSTCPVAGEHVLVGKVKAQVKMALALENKALLSPISTENMKAQVRMALSSLSIENSKSQTKMALALENPESMSYTLTESNYQPNQRESLRKVPSIQKAKGARLTSPRALDLDHNDLISMDKKAEITDRENFDQSDLISNDIEAELSERETLTRYFPNLQGWENAPCLGCAKTGHCWSDCPFLSCTQCEDYHSCNSCPKTRRCDRCRELGHSVAECPEKLALPKSQIFCDLCRCTGHVESACHHIWRTFQPNPQEILKVQSIHVYCYCCGAAGHYGSECGLNRHQAFPAATTWSRANLNMYVDPSSSNRALSASVDLSLPVRKGFNIKGKALNPVASDDESETGRSFIRPKIRKVDHGIIRFAPVVNNPYRPSSSRDYDGRIAQNCVIRRESNLPRGPRLQSTSAGPERTDERLLNQHFQVQEESLPPKIQPSRIRAPHSARKVSKSKKNSTQKTGRHQRAGKKGAK